MGKPGSFKPLIRQGWLRALLFFIVLVLATGISISVYIIALHKGNPDTSGLQNLMKGDNLLSVTGIFFVLSLLITIVFRRWIDRKTFISLGLDFSGHEGEAIAGGMLAIFIICASSLLLKATGHLKWMDIIFDPKALFLALLISALLFVIFHWTGQSSIGFFSLANTLIMGLIIGLNYIFTRNLWFS